MTADEPVKYKDERKGPDIWIRTISFLGVAGWLVLLAAMIIAEQARPEPQTVTTRFHNIAVRTSWDKELATYIFFLMIAGVCMSVTGLLINARRLRRKYDQLRINLILMLVISLSGIIAYLFFL